MAMVPTWSLLLVVAMLVTSVTSTCHMTDDVCEFWLEISHKMTMMADRKAVYPHQGQLFNYDVSNPDNATVVEADGVVTADGWEPQRLIIVANGTMPGPSIEVWEDQQVVVHVTNKMTSQATTIHWHGLHQVGTPWMDGVAYVTQCPIQPYQTFTYRFKAAPRGTFWYHSHIGTQLSMGLLGALIIREKKPLEMQEHIVMLMEWNHHIDADLMHMRMVYGNYENRTKLGGTDSLEGGHFSMFPFDAGLINGKGRFYYPDGSHNGAPLTTFDVTSGDHFRFRVIGAGSLYPFRFSIDDHPLTVVASDGYELDPVVVESFIINPGERYDVTIHADQSVKSYWVRAKSLEVDVDNHRADAILKYAGSADGDPTTSRKTCTALDRCVVVNCPFLQYPADQHTDCVSVGSLESLEVQDTPGADGEDIEDIFLNFAFPGIDEYPGSVNGRAFVKPGVSALTQPQEMDRTCDASMCGDDKICHCRQALTLEHNKVYQFTFSNIGNGKGWAHPIHMHGHTFYVVKTGYPAYNAITGKLLGNDTEDIYCNHKFCNNAKWANASWSGNSVPGLQLARPARKDTIMVPTGGYVVVRIKADNPGLWFMHCHIELHAIDGMAMMLNESFPQHAKPPRGFPQCGSFAYENNMPLRSRDMEDEMYTEKTFWSVVGALIALAVIQLLVIVYCACASSRNKGSGSITQPTTRGGNLNKAYTIST